MIGGKRINLNRKGTLTWLKYRKKTIKGNYGKSRLEPLIAVIEATDNRNKLLSKLNNHKRGLFRDLTDDTPRFIEPIPIELSAADINYAEAIESDKKAIFNALKIPHDRFDQTELPKQT
jgi:hypothetical protein